MNASESGLSFETFAPIGRERFLQFWFSLDLKERIEASGRLAWLDPQGKVGGLRFLDLSPKAQRHLHTHLGSNSGRQSEPSVGTHQGNANNEEPAKGSVFLAALAKRSLGELTFKPQVGEDTTFPEPNSVTADSRSNTGTERTAGQPAGRFVSLDPTEWVSLERHLATSRRQLIRGMLIGVVLSLTVVAVAGRYFGRKQAKPEAAPALAAPAKVGDPATPVPGVSQAPTIPISSTPVSARQAPAAHYLPDNPRPDGASSPSASVALPGAGIAPEHKIGIEPPREGESNGSKKSRATPQQLWAAVQGGNAKAAVELADRFIKGDGVPVNCDQARVLLLVASERNNADAIRKLHELDKAGSGCSVP